MIRLIAAVDSNLGVADDHGIPWQGKVPSDVAYFRQQITGATILMGHQTYLEFKKPFPNCVNYVASSKHQPLLPGFNLTSDARKFLSDQTQDVWVIGGPGLFAQTIDIASELYLTRLEGDYQCTKFFPKFEDRFKLISSSEPMIENGVKFHFEIWNSI